MNAKESLERKLVSEAELNAVIDRNSLFNTPSRWYNPAGLCTRTSSYASLPWWLKREHLRIDNGVYQSSEVLASINSSWATQYAVHVSKADAAMVAFTPSPEYGEQDRQLTTTLGKFLRKHFLTLTDAHIQSLEQDHRAELNATFELAESIEDIEYVYRHMEGDTACMRNAPAAYSLNDDTHPSHVYAAPGMGVAFTNRNGKVMSRAVVWTNPADPDDKRFVRLYGEPILGTLLTRAGYRMANLAGSKIRRIAKVDRGSSTPSNKYYFVVPYLDGIGGDQSKPDGTYVVDYGDADYLSLVTREEAMRIKGAAGDQYATQSKSTGAVIRLEPLPKMQYVSDISGIEYSGYETPSVQIWLAHAKRIGVAARDELGRDIRNWTEVRRFVDEDSEMEKFYMHNGSMATFEHDWNTYVDDTATRTRMGFHKLSPKYYPQDSDWFRGATRMVEGGLVKAEDTYAVLPQEGGQFYVHETMVPAMRKKGFVNCSPVYESPTITHKARPTAHRTPGGTWFDSEEHDQFKLTMENIWVHRKHAQGVSMFSQTVYTSRDNPYGDATVVAHLFAKSAYADRCKEMTETYSALSDVASITTAMDAVKSYATRAVKTWFNWLYKIRQDNIGKYVFDQNYDVTPTWPLCVAFADEVGRMQDIEIDTRQLQDVRTTATVIDVVRGFIDPLLATLAARKNQLELEAAGQLRIEDAPEELECA